MTVSHWQETAGGQARVSHDVVVVGAGLIGSYMAGLLAESGSSLASADLIAQVTRKADYDQQIADYL